MKKKVFFILGSGGHTKQILLLEKNFDNNLYEKYYICSKKDNLSIKKISQLIYSENLILVERPKEVGESYLHAILKNIFLLKIINQLIHAFVITNKMNKSLVITAGPSTGIFIYILAYLRRNYCVYIESWSRVKQLSFSGKVLYFFSNSFFVQWQELLKDYPFAIYRGRLG